MKSIEEILSQFIETHSLPNDYRCTAERWFIPLLPKIHADVTAKRLSVLGIVGSQGSGKSTLAALYQALLSQHFGFNVVSLSLDDFYLTRAERAQLAEQVHPLLATRGVPGTHDINLAMLALDQLLTGRGPVAVPSFNKAEDDRWPPEHWPSIDAPVDLVILEGWCLCAQAQPAADILMPINELEETEDADGHWRGFVNQQLETNYPRLWERVDRLLMLQAPSFSIVSSWRRQQETKLAQHTSGSQIMGSAAIDRFVSFFERITRHLLTSLPNHANVVFSLTQQQNISRCRYHPANEKPQRVLVFSDLDGTLLDHHNYSFSPAVPVLQMLEHLDIPLILNTSKTFAELIVVRKKLNNRHPFIVENGSAIVIPNGYFPDFQPNGNAWQLIELAPRRQRLLDWLANDCQDFSGQFVGFSQMSVFEVMQATQLDEAGAQAAMDRQYSEPLQWLGSESARRAFIDHAENNGLQVIEGGRFLHLQSLCNKGAALARLLSVYALQRETSFEVIAAGDSDNDLPMLNLADWAIVVRSPGRSPLQCAKAVRTVIGNHEGPAGWAQAIEGILLASSNVDGV